MRITIDVPKVPVDASQSRKVRKYVQTRIAEHVVEGRHALLKADGVILLKSLTGSQIQEAIRLLNQMRPNKP